MKNKLFTLLRVLISFTLIVLLIWFLRDKIPAMIDTIKTADMGLLSIGFFIFLFALIIIAFRLIRVISVQTIYLNAKESMYLTFIGYFFNNFLPTSFGGDAVKAYYAGKKSNNKAGAFSGVFMDRVLAMLPFTLIPALAVTFMANKIDNKGLIIIVYLLFLGCLVFLWLLLHKETAKYLAYILEPFKTSLWYEKIKNGYAYLNIYRKHKLVMLQSFILSVLAQTCSIVSTYFFARAIGIDYVGIEVFFVVVPIVWVMTLIPSLNGLGVREGGFVYLLRSYMPEEKAFAISIMVLASLAIFGVIGGIIYSFQKHIFTFKEEELE
ncbi:MAG: flippase-like domain-containing protein [Candidatus Omnitrophica bacterium]|nr:flippase-like domain-containing protein [Candidatus Omnitrophota bacterium]